MPSSMEKIIDLIKKTNDKCIVLDTKGEPAFVAMSFSDYEKLISSTLDVSNLTEEQLLERINRHIAVWKVSQQEEDSSNNWQDLEESAGEAVRLNQKSESSETKPLNQAKDSASEDKYYFEPIE